MVIILAEICLVCLLSRRSKRSLEYITFRTISRCPENVDWRREWWIDIYCFSRKSQSNFRESSLVTCLFFLLSLPSIYAKKTDSSVLFAG